MSQRAVTPAAQGRAAGFYGKLPARGDFVGAGLPRDFIAGWDAWWQAMLVASRATLGEAWLPAWMEAPIWRFALLPGTCGAAGVVGLWMPSVDRAGRHFPLTIAAVCAETDLTSLSRAGNGFLAEAEQAGLDALEHDFSPDALAARVAAARMADDVTPAPPAVGVETASTLWWTAGGPFVGECAFALPDLPDSATFARMLSDGSAAAAGVTEAALEETETLA